MHIEINEEERGMLIGLLEREIGELGPEIHHTMTPKLHRELKEDKQIFKHLLDRLHTAVGS